MIGELRTKYSGWGMASNPLMATLLCLAYSPYSKREPLPFPLRRGAVYERVLWGLLGEWSKQRDEQELRALSEEEKKRCAAKLDLLAEVAYHFFLQGAERFSRTALEAEMRRYLFSERGELFYAEETLRWSGALTDAQNNQIKLLEESAQRKLAEKNVIARLCQELIEHDGLLALDSQDEKESWYGFLHLTVQEYLTACAMARQANDEGWHTIEKLVNCKAWVPEWEETLILLTGRLDNPIPWLELLMDAGQDDYFRHRLCLAARCLPELSVPGHQNLSGHRGNKNERFQQITTRIAGDVLNLWWEHRERSNMFPHIERNLPALAQGSPTTILPVLLQRLHDADDQVRGAAAEALGKVGASAATDPDLAALVTALHSADSEVRDSAAAALGQIGARAATDPVLAALVTALHDTDAKVRHGAAEALRWMKASAVTEPILAASVTALHDANYEMHRSVAEALGKVGASAATDPDLAALVTALHSADSEVRDSAAAALGQIGARAATDPVLAALVTALHDGDGWTRSKAVEVLGWMGDCAATESVLAALVDVALHDAEYWMRSNAIGALGKMGARAATEPVLAALVDVALHDAEYWMPSMDECAVAASLRLVTVLRDARWVGTAEALEKMGARAAAKLMPLPWVTILDDEKDRMRYSAIEALGKIGDCAATESVLAALVDVALHDAEYWMRSNAIGALGKMGARAATEPVLAVLLDVALHNAYGEMRYRAAEALGKTMAQGVRVFKKRWGKWEKKRVVELGQFVSGS
jgi:HEAT repeat protein